MSEMAVGQTHRLAVNLTAGTLEVDVVLLDTRRAYGRIDWLVAPITGGDNSVWVSQDTLITNDDDEREDET